MLSTPLTRHGPRVRTWPYRMLRPCQIQSRDALRWMISAQRPQKLREDKAEAGRVCAKRSGKNCATHCDRERFLLLARETGSKRIGRNRELMRVALRASCGFSLQEQIRFLI